MIPIGLGVVWVGYTAGIWGYCLVRNYNVTLVQLMKTTWPGPASSRAGAGPAASSPSSAGSAVPAVQGSAASEAQQAGGFIPKALQQLFGRPFGA